MSGLTAASMGALGDEDDRPVTRLEANTECRKMLNEGYTLNSWWCKEARRLNDLAAASDSVISELTPTPLVGPSPAPSAPAIGPVQPTAAEWAAMPALPPAPDKALTQRAVARANVRVATSLSAHAQAAAIRAQFASAQANRQRVLPRPMTERQQMQATLAARGAGKKLGTGATVALVALGSVAILALGSAAFGRK